jgi:ornithine cyclodeaminase
LKVFPAAEVAAALPYGELAEALRLAFAEPVESPPRHVHETGGSDLFMLMPAWTKRWIGLKVLTLTADNPSRGLAFIQGNYLLMDRETGRFLASMDGTELTRRRTAAASALAASWLARKDASTHLVVGAGALALHFAQAHRAVRPITRTLICNRTRPKAEAAARELAKIGIAAEVMDDLEQAVRSADIISCITGSSVPLVRGKWLRPGQHLDLAGAYRPDMRETDAEAVARARVYVDTREGASHEAGDLLQAEKEGAFSMHHIVGELADLATGRVHGRETAEEITLFKSCGTAIEDLAAAAQVYLHEA